MEMPQEIACLFSSWKFLCDFPVIHSLQRTKQIADEVSLTLSETGLLILTNVCYCFNSKGDHFNVMKLLSYCHLLTTTKRPNVLQAILLAINGLSGFMFKTIVRKCENLVFNKSTDNSIVESRARHLMNSFGTSLEKQMQIFNWTKSKQK